MSGKCYILARKNPQQKVLFLLAYLFYSSPFLRDADYRVLWGELRRYIGTFFGARLSCRGIVIWPSFRQRTPQGFFAGVVFSGFRGFCFCSFSLSLLFSFSSFWWPAWVPLLVLLVACLAGPRRTPGIRTGGSSNMHGVMSFFLSLPGSAAFPSLLPPSALSVFLSSLQCLLHASRSARLGPLWKAHRDGNRLLPLLLHWSVVSPRNS